MPGRPSEKIHRPNYLGHCLHHLAKELTIDVDEQAVNSGQALEMLSQEPYEGCAFPSALAIRFNMVIYATNTNRATSPLETEANINAFVQRIMGMAPKVRRIKVFPDIRGPDLESIGIHFGDLVSRLYQLVKHIEYDVYFYSVVPMELRLDVICDLVHINCYSGGNCQQFIQLAQLNASSLESIVIEAERNMDISSLILNVNGSYVTYPHVLKLKLTESISIGKSERPMFDGALPFPILQSLSLKLQYQFGDDTLFRGNAASLRFLEMFMDCPTASMLFYNKVFSPSSHPQLQCVSIDSVGVTSLGPFASCNDYMRFVLNIGRNACVRGITSLPDISKLTPALSLLENHACIQVLSLLSMPLNLWNVLAVVKCLPLLSDLRTLCPILVNTPSGISQGSLPDYVLRTYTPMGERFRCWQIDEIFYENITTAICVLLMALACPNWSHVVPPPCDLSEFFGLIEDELNSDMFREYAPQLRRLLPRE
ncbi:hypothetical protein LPJ71_006117 [Coemansia sp. S17]|nr:hypothetical protein LPJ71_006117 [Coemansia sp. S17]